MAAEPALGTKIKKARERLRWTQKRLADELGVSQKTVDNWEHGRTAPKSSIGALEAILGVRFDEDEPPPSIPPGVMAVIKRNYPDPKQQARAIEAFEALGPPTEPSSTQEEGPSERRHGRAS